MLKEWTKTWRNSSRDNELLKLDKTTPLQGFPEENEQFSPTPLSILVNLSVSDLARPPQHMRKKGHP